MATGTDIIRRARRLISDEATSTVSGQRWTNAELLKYITEAQRAVVSLKPEAYVHTRLFEVADGVSRQRLTANALVAETGETSAPPPYRLVRVEANNGEVVLDSFVFMAGGPSGGYNGYISGVVGSVVTNTTPYTFTAFRSNLGYGDLIILSTDLFDAVEADPAAFQFHISGPGVDVTFLGSSFNLGVPGQLGRLSTGEFQVGEEYTCTIESV